MFHLSTKRAFALIVSLILLTACSGLGGEPQTVATLPPNMLGSSNPNAQSISMPTTAPDIALGAQIYAENCTRCHGIGGKGDGELVKSGQIASIMDFTDPATTQDKTPSQYFDVITNGRLETSLMPPWKGSLDDNQRWAVAMYVYTLPHTATQIAQGRDLWNANCASCHGGNGEGVARGAPLPELWTKTQGELRSVVANGIVTPDGTVADMPAYVDKLSATERENVILYARSLNLTNITAVGTKEVAQVPEPAGTDEVVTAPVETVEATPSATVTITGTITNGSEGGAQPKGLTVTLYAFADAQNYDEIGTTAMNDDGTYTFEGVNLHTAQGFATTTTYNDVLFASDSASSETTEGQITLPITVYEISDDASKVEIETFSSQIAVEDNLLQVIQIVRFVTTDNFAYRGADGTSVKLTAPEGATIVNFMGENTRFQFTDREIIDTEPVVPGQTHTLHMMYTLPYSGESNVAQPVNYALQNGYEVLIATAGLTVSGEKIQPLGGRNTSAGTVMSFGTTDPQTADALMQFTVSGTPTTMTTTTTTASTSNNSTQTIAFVLIGIGGIAVGAAGALFIKDRKSGEAVPNGFADQDRMNVLVKEIADLDIDHQAGKISKSQYDKRRNQLKAELAALMKKNGKA